MTVNLQTFYEDFDLPTVRRNMDESGFYVFENRLGAECLRGLRSRIDELSESDGTEVNYGGSEHRIWHAETRSSEFAQFQKLSDWIMPQLYGAAYPSYTVLAIRNRPAPPHAARTDSRWHLDSFRRQLKLFAFLTDVTTESGPLEYIPGTHKPAFKWRAMLPLGLYGPRDFIHRRSGERSWQKIHDRSIDKVVSWGYEPKEMTLEAGSLLLVETSALHRAKPCATGERYAVTVYHR